MHSRNINHLAGLVTRRKHLNSRECNIIHVFLRLRPSFLCHTIKMAGSDDLDLPIALRRTPRHCVGAAAAARSARPRSDPAPASIITKTPSKPRPKKRVRFSDPGPDSSCNDTVNSTGLTPMIKRSWLGEPSPKRRRTPAAISRRASTSDIQEEASVDEVFELPSADSKRRTRRKVPLEESPGIEGPQKKKTTKAQTRKEKEAATAKVEAELQRLRAELAERDAEIERLHNETMVHDTERIVELEKQIEELRAELAQQQLPAIALDAEEDESADEEGNEDGQPSQSFYDWTLAARDPFSDTYSDADTMMEDVACSTPSRRQKVKKIVTPKSASASFPTPPNTSPTLPATPCSARRAFTPVTPQSHIGIQASFPDPEKDALEAELGSLRLELTKLTDTLESHSVLQRRLSDKLSSASFVPEKKREEAEQLELEAKLDLVLQQLSDRTAALSEVTSSISALGFAGTDACEIIASIAAGFRTARLELEYLDPGELALPLSSHGAEVLDLVLARLRELARKAREDDDAIDEYHELELSLRQQLSARVDAMVALEQEAEQNQLVLRERDERIAELEVGLDRLKGAVEGYRRDIVQMEEIVQKVDEESKTTTIRLKDDLSKAQTELQDTRGSLDKRGREVAELEKKLADAMAETSALEKQLKDLQMRKDAETKVRNKSHGSALALRDARVMELRREIYGINDKLRSAHETIMKLRVENAGLERRAEKAAEEEKNAKEAVDAMKAELEKVVAAAAATAAAAAPGSRRRTRSSSKEPTTPEPGSFLSGEFARSGLGKKGKKRRYDSGLGFLDEEEDDGGVDDTEEVELVS